MRNALFPRMVGRPSTTYRDRRFRRRYPVVSPATLKPVAEHAFDAEMAVEPAIEEQLVVLHDVSLDGVGLRSRLPLNVCSRYQIQCEDRNVFLRKSQLRVVSCRRGRDGMYEIGAQLC